MPLTKFLSIQINSLPVDLGDIDKVGLLIDYLLEEPHNFSSKQGSQSFGLVLPATKNNDQIFNTYWNPQVEDLSPGSSFRDIMDVKIYVNGTELIFLGYAILQSAACTNVPVSYTINIYGGNGEWILDMQTMTLWDCVNPDPHYFTVAQVETSWSNFNTAGDGTDDFLYLPVRYAQPFDGTTLGYQGDNCVNIYHLRPSISPYWILRRAFNQLGFTLNSQFMATDYFQKLFMPWTWGDFYDINSQLVEGICFKAAGQVTKEAAPLSASTIPFWTGTTSGSTTGSADGSSWWNTAVSGGWNPGAYLGGLATLSNGIDPTGGVYVFSGNGTTPSGFDWFRMNITNPPSGYDNFTLYSFDDTTGTMQYSFTPPTSLVGTMANVSINFLIDLYAVITSFAPNQSLLALECTHVLTGGGPDVVTCQSIMPSGGAIIGAQTFPLGSGFPTTPISCNVIIPNCNPGDVLKFRIRCLASGSGNCTFGVFTGGLLNNNPAVLGVPSYAYNPVTQQFGLITPNSIWSPLRSDLIMTGFLIQIGNQVNMKNYDAFRAHQILDFIGGLVDTFNLEIQTDPINKVVTIEPMFGGTLPDGTTYDGYFSSSKYYEWTGKMDVNKGSTLSLFSDSQRQIDLTFKLDGSDGAQTIWSQRTKGIFLSNRTYTGGIDSNGNVDNGTIASIPGAARYMLPNRFAKGNNQLQNRFFSSVMHCTFPVWKDYTGVMPQMICIFPQSQGASDAFAQAFEPKLAYYKGYHPASLDYAAFIWLGDPASPNTSPVHSLPLGFAVNYFGVGAATDPVLSYSDENIGGTQCKGLMSQFFRQRFAIMRNGQLMEANLRLNLYDVCNWEHRESIMLNKSRYALIQIQGYNPLSDDSNPVTMWKIVSPEQVDEDNSYPSTNSIITQPLILTNPYDLRYAQLLIYPSDLPQIE